MGGENKELTITRESLVRTLSRVLDHQLIVAKRRDTTIEQIRKNLEGCSSAMSELVPFPKTNVLDDQENETRVAEIDAIPIATDVVKGRTIVTFISSDGKIYTAIKSRRDYPTIIVLSTMTKVNLNRNKKLAIKALSGLANSLKINLL